MPGALTARPFGERGRAIGGVALIVRLASRVYQVSMSSRLATVDVEDLPGDEAGLFQVEDPVGDVADLARATEWVGRS